MKINKSSIFVFITTHWGMFFRVIILLISKNAAAHLRFDPAMISDDPNEVADLSLFDKTGKQLPGIYNVTVYLNGSRVASQDIRFVSVRSLSVKKSGIKDNTGLVACLTKNDLSDMGVKVALTPQLKKLPDTLCISPADYIPSAFTAFNFAKMKLDISIPQAALVNQPKGWISTEKWDNGINAALMSWQFSGNETQGKYGRSLSQYLNLTSGLNLGSWRLRDNSIWTHSLSGQYHHQTWQHLSTYLQRSLVSWRSLLTLGNSQSDGRIFEPFSFYGMQLATDENMYPDTLRGFAPTIKGVAASNAEVSVRQNGNLIYRTTVPPGAFVIKDLYPVSNAGDLQVVVREANGSDHSFIVPYSSVPVLQRKGHVVYSIASGRFKNNSKSYREVSFAHGTFLWGLTSATTLYGGTELASGYRAAALGIGVNVGYLGAISADVTRAASTLSDNSRHQGSSWRLLYARSLVSTGTTFQLMTNRFSTRGYHSLAETALKDMRGWVKDPEPGVSGSQTEHTNWVNHYNLYQAKKNLLQINVSQRLGKLGSLFMTGSRQTYWGNAAATSSLQAGFSSTVGKISYQISLGYSKFNDQPIADKNVYVSLSVPLDDGLFSGDHFRRLRNTSLTYSLNHDNNGHTVNQVQLYGTALSNNNLSWGVTQGYDQQRSHSGDVSLDYQGTYGMGTLGYGYSNDYRQVRYGASGGALLSAYGLTVGQPLGSTNILVAAPGGADIPVENSTGVSTDWRGYTIKNFASVYRENRIALDVGELNNSTDISNPVKYVVPTEGAVVLAKFNVHKGKQAILTLYHLGKPLPFGTIISTADGKNTGIVADNGEVYLSGLSGKGELTASWGADIHQSCKIHYTFSEKQKSDAIIQSKESCY